LPAVMHATGFAFFSIPKSWWRYRPLIIVWRRKFVFFLEVSGLYFRRNKQKFHFIVEGPEFQSSTTNTKTSRWTFYLVSSLQLDPHNLCF